jgi:Flp pilus assembly CpaE family ATPase
VKVAILRPRLAFKCVESGALGGCAVAERADFSLDRFGRQVALPTVANAAGGAGTSELAACFAKTLKQS